MAEEVLDKIDVGRMGLSDLALIEKRQAAHRKMAKRSGSGKGRDEETVFVEKETLRDRQSSSRRKAKEFVLGNVDKYLAELERIATTSTTPAAAKLKAIELQMKLAGVIDGASGKGIKDAPGDGGGGAVITREDLEKIRLDVELRGMKYPALVGGNV